MSFNKISLFLLLCFTNCSHIIAMFGEEKDCSIIMMENTEQSTNALISQIRDKLGRLDDSILNCSQQLQLAKDQKNKDKTIYNNYLAQEQKRIANSWFFTSINYQTNEVYNYKGRRHCLNARILVVGSKEKYESLKEKLSEREVIYAQFVANLQRGECCADTEPQKATIYLSNMNARLQKLLNAIAKEEKKEEEQK